MLMHKGIVVIVLLCTFSVEARKKEVTEGDEWISDVKPKTNGCGGEGIVRNAVKFFNKF